MTKDDAFKEYEEALDRISKQANEAMEDANDALKEYEG